MLVKELINFCERQMLNCGESDMAKERWDEKDASKVGKMREVVVKEEEEGSNREEVGTKKRIGRRKATWTK